MKIAILGTRGIPNNYGGFEQFAEIVSVALADRGLNVTVYSPHNHPYKENTYNNVSIRHCFDPEFLIGTAGQFIYDLNCINDCRSQNFDVILQLGYTSNSVWSFRLPKTRVVTNMDGLEWKRSKYSKLVQRFLLFAERLAVRSSTTLIADSIGIQDYLSAKFNTSSTFIPYGAVPFEDPQEQVLSEYNLVPNNYYVIIARMEPENNIEIVISGFLESGVASQLIVIGSYTNSHGKRLKKSFECDQVRFLGPIYNQNVLNNIRFFSQGYFHGHSVGGTNPSLLEAMASRAFIIANNNIFNKAILGEDALYFRNAEDVKTILDLGFEDKREQFLSNNSEKIVSKYSWSSIVDRYYAVLTNA